MIGDAWSDLLAGQAAGVPRVAILKTGRGGEQLLQPKPASLMEYFIFNDLSEAVKKIQELDTHP
jgi:phosphoglycolate phosphatase-like HAD superfamily hydrolase